MKIKELEINEVRQYTTGNIHLTTLPKKKVLILTSKYGEVTSASLNKTQVKRVISWLQKWVKLVEDDALSEESEVKNG